MSKRALLVSLAFFVLMFGVAVKNARGQAVYGTVVGTVTDPQGAGVVGAKVTVTSIEKGSVDETTTNESGNFTVGHLIPDNYKIRIEATGFKAYDITSVLVQVDTVVRADARLEVGSITQSVEVTGELPQLQTEKSDVSTTFQAETIENLPIYNRNFTTLQLLTPGNQRMNGWNHAASENPQGSQQIMTQGQHFAGTGFELDGTDNEDAILGIIVINPNLEAINEVKITTQDYDAEFGKAIGLIATTQTKSGTNQLHGEAFDFERSDSNFARNPFTQAPGISPGVPGGNWNQFGGTIGGPIKKDKIFFFTDYQGTRSHVGGSASERIPTAAERAGNLSDLGVTLYDPYMTTDAAHTTVATDASGNPIFLQPAQRSQATCPIPADFCGAFPGNIIPTSRLSPQSQYLLSNFIPVGANGTGLNPNFFGSGSNVLNSDNFDVRGDYIATTKIQVFGRYSFQQFTRSGPGLFGTEAGGEALPSDPSVGNFAGNSSVRNQSLAAGFDYTFSSNLLTDFRFGWFRYRVGTTPGGVGTDPATKAGIPNLNVDNFYTSGMPYFAVNTPGASLFSFGYALGQNSEIQCNCPLTEQEYQYQFVNNWTKIKGNHSIKFGVDLRHAHNLRVPSDAHRAGQLDFNNDITEGPGGVGGAGLAGFLLGDVSAFQRYVSTSTNATETQPRLFFYGQDTWRVTPKLTLNLGLRWEIYVPESARGTGQGGWIDLGTGEVRVAGENNVNLMGNTSTSFTHLAPRLGVAYQINPKTVLRLGYGRSYDIGVFGSIFGHFITQNLPVLAQQSTSPAKGNAAFTLAQGPVNFTPLQVLENNCNPITDPTGVQPNGTFVPTQTTCTGATGRPYQPNGVGGNSRPFNNRIPTVDTWNVSLQRQLTPTITATAAYVGNKGTHTFIGDNPAYNPNGATNIGYNPNCTYLPGSYTEPNPATCPNGSQPYNNLQPYYLKYGWTQGINYAGNDANSNYESLQLTLEKRFSNGLSLQSSYTFQNANNYDDNGCFNVCNHGNNSLEYGPSSDYRNQVFILTEVYQLPFGQGKKYGSNVNKATNYIIGGWTLNSSWNFSSGLPYTYSLSTCSPEIGNGPCRANIVGAVQEGKRSGTPTAANYWFETTNGVSLANQVCSGAAPASAGPWAQAPCDTFGNAGRNAARGPKFFNVDFGLFKDFTLTERMNLQFQFEAYNLFNHANLDLPNTCVDCSNGGSITNIAYGSNMRRLQFGLKFAF